MGYGDSPPSEATMSGAGNFGQGTRRTNNRNVVKRPITSVKKAISYGAANDLLLDIDKDSSASAHKHGDIREIRVTNEGSVPAYAIFKYALWDDSTTLNSDARYVHYLLNPRQKIIIPTSRAIVGDHDTVVYHGTAVTDTTPAAAMYVDSTANVDSATANGVVNSTSDTTVYLEPYTSAANCTANLFRIGDLIRIRDEIMEVTAIGSKAALATNTLTVKRGMFGSTAVTSAADGDAVRLAYFNQHHEFDKFSVAQTDINGAYKSSNFFGLGRSATVGAGGIVPGSVVIGPFYDAGYQELGMTGITPNTESGLTASTNYMLDIQVDGGTNFDNLSFTTDATNTKFGGSTGVISKIQSALNTQYYTAGNLFEKGVRVSIVNGDVRITSESRLSGSAIALTVEDGSGTSIFGVGRIPAIGNIKSAIAAQLPDQQSYNPITYGTSYNNVFIRDDGNGNLWSNGLGSGRINYETGGWSITGAPKLAQFNYSVNHTSPFSGKLDATATGKQNQLQQVLGNLPNQKCEVVLRVETF